MNNDIPHLGFCSSCKTGPLLVRLCGGCGLPCVLCDECDAMWVGPEVDAPPMFPAEEDASCLHCGGSLWSEESSWASADRLTEMGWGAYIVAKDEEGGPN